MPELEEEIYEVVRYHESAMDGKIPGRDGWRIEDRLAEGWIFAHKIDGWYYFKRPKESSAGLSWERDQPDDIKVEDLLKTFGDEQEPKP